MLRECIQELESAPASDPVLRDRIGEMADFVESLVALYEEAQRLPPKRLRGLVKVRKIIRKALGKSAPDGAGTLPRGRLKS
jgi:hypothetical protein